MEFFVKKFSELSVNELYEILKSRAEVFLIEQGIICQDMDDIDYKSSHYFFKDNERVIAYLRAFECEDDLNTLSIGRVLTIEHGKGIGRELMERSLLQIKNERIYNRIILHAQKHAIGFYEKFGFKVISDEFLEEGVIHVTMEYKWK